MNISKRTKGFLCSILLIALCLVVGNVITGGVLVSVFQSISDVSPPHATFSFIVKDGRMHRGSLIIAVGKEFTPMVTIEDDKDPSPTVEVWISPVNSSAFNLWEFDDATTKSVTIDQPMTINHSGYYRLSACVRDASGNTMTYTSIINVFD